MHSCGVVSPAGFTVTSIGGIGSAVVVIVVGMVVVGKVVVCRVVVGSVVFMVVELVVMLLDAPVPPLPCMHPAPQPPAVVVGVTVVVTVVVVVVEGDATVRIPVCLEVALTPWLSVTETDAYSVLPSCSEGIEYVKLLFRAFVPIR